MKRNTVEIRVWMVRNRIKYSEIMRSLGLSDMKQIRLTIKGDRNHRKTLEWLENKGCPRKFLAIPPSYKEAA